MQQLFLWPLESLKCSHSLGRYFSTEWFHRLLSATSYGRAEQGLAPTAPLCGTLQGPGLRMPSPRRPSAGLVAGPGAIPLSAEMRISSEVTLPALQNAPRASASNLEAEAPGELDWAASVRPAMQSPRPPVPAQTEPERWLGAWLPALRTEPIL